MKEFVEIEALPNKKDVKDFKMLKALSRAYKELNAENEFKEIKLDKKYKEENKIPIAQINLTKLNNKIENMDKHIQNKIEDTKKEIKKIVNLDLDKRINMSKTEIIKNSNLLEEKLLKTIDDKINEIKDESKLNKKDLLNEIQLINLDINDLLKNQNKNNNEIELIKDILYDLYQIEEIDNSEITSINKKIVQTNKNKSVIEVKKTTKSNLKKEDQNNFIHELEIQLGKVELEMINLNPLEYDIYKKRVNRLKKIIREKKNEMVS